jgi:hypothetical protein
VADLVAIIDRLEKKEASLRILSMGIDTAMLIQLPAKSQPLASNCLTHIKQKACRQRKRR